MTFALLAAQGFALACTIIVVCAGPLSPCKSRSLTPSGVSAADISNVNSYTSIRQDASSPGCYYEGQWYVQGAIIASREECLRCSCLHGAVACQRRSCASPSGPLPEKCHLILKKGNCCPELHCPDGVTSMENTGAVRMEDDLLGIATSPSIVNACVEGGTVYTAGSAMSSNVACEQCFCLGGTRRCVQPQCLPPPPGCRPRPAPGVCCPQKYYCEHTSTTRPDDRMHDCKVNGKWMSEGERVVVSESSRNCTQCFCLHGAVRCQPLLCAPPLLGCKPMLRPGECCPHQYHCQHQGEPFAQEIEPIFGNAVASNKYRSFHTPKYQKYETSTRYILNKKNILSISDAHLVPTNKVKRKTNDSPTSTSQKSTNVISTALNNTTKPVSEAISINVTTEKVTEQPEGSVKIMINGTINCTTEISSTTIPVNKTRNETEFIKMDVQPRKPIINIDSLEDHTFSPNDIITDRNVNAFDDIDTFTINVTSSLNANVSRSTRPPMVTVSKNSVPTDLSDALNASKKTKGDYDYDYTEPTLPPSLPNLKIIPFVAADAVVEDESEKETLTYPMLEREDKFPVYFPSADAKRTPYATKKSDVYNPTQYPIFISNKESQYPSLTNVESSSISEQPYNHEDLEYSVSTSLGNRILEESKVVTISPTASSTFEMETPPPINLFSPPVETEGGFVPKAPELIDDYYSVYPSTSPAASVPHLTTSMQLDVSKGECLSSDGRHVFEGESINFGCSECTCAWGELHCSPRPCHTPAGCRRRPASITVDLCCGELICDEDNKSTPIPLTTTAIKLNNDTKVKVENISLTIKVDTPSAKSNSSNKNSTDIKPQDKNKIEKDVNKKSNEQTVTDSPSLSKTSASIVLNTPTTKEQHQVTVNTVSIPLEQNNHTLNNSQEYEDDEDDEGFSFGSVLKLLLSESFETTTLASQRITTTKAPLKPTFKTTTRKPLKQTIKPFIPLPPRPYIPPSQAQNSVSRIDHLVLGEATAIHSTIRPMSTKSSTAYTQKVRPLEITKKETLSGQYTSVTHEGPRPPSGGLGAGLLKLAGCNIYGRMYRVGRIITELSSPCQECWCTELGVQCKPLKC